MNSNNSVNITNAAVQHFKDILAKEQSAMGIRIGVKDSGCSGLAYTVDFARDQSTDDEVIVYDELSLFINKDSIKFIAGTTIDYVKQGVNYLLKFDNPNATDECGCGESFQVKK